MYLSSNIIVQKKGNKKKSERKVTFSMDGNINDTVYLLQLINFMQHISYITRVPTKLSLYNSLTFPSSPRYFRKIFYLNIRIICIIELCIDAITVAFSCISYRNQLFGFLCKSNDWFLYQMQHWAEIGYSNVFN